jgi:hypothetical protein
MVFKEEAAGRLDLSSVREMALGSEARFINSPAEIRPPQDPLSIEHALALEPEPGYIQARGRDSHHHVETAEALCHGIVPWQTDPVYGTETIIISICG